VKGLGDVCTGRERTRVEGDVEEEAVCWCRRGEGASPSIDGLELALSDKAFACTAATVTRVTRTARCEPTPVAVALDGSTGSSSIVELIAEDCSYEIIAGNTALMVGEMAEAQKMV